MTTGRLFGTDGVRGVANEELTPQLAFDLAPAAAGSLDGPSGDTVLIGRDTRRSGPMLTAALQSGFNSVGVDTVDLGVIPVGGVSRLIRSEGAAMGVMVSASHNPAADNGVKLIGPNGNKLPDAEEEAIAARYFAGGPHPQPTGAGVGWASELTDAGNRYVGQLSSRRPPRSTAWRSCSIAPTAPPRGPLRSCSPGSAPMSRCMPPIPTGSTSTTASAPPTRRPWPRWSGDGSGSASTATPIDWSPSTRTASSPTET